MSGFRDSFTKDEYDKESTLNYDDSASLYFIGAVLTAIVVPWTVLWLRSLFAPSSAASSTFSEKGSRFTMCRTEEMMKKFEEEKRAESSFSKKVGNWGVIKFVTLALLWASLISIVAQVGGQSSEIKSFDPYEILEIAFGASTSDIKRAYRKLSLKHHPDKNPNDPLANAKFIQVSKAYQSLTDEDARANYEKYGNPDGPSTMKVGIGLPRFLVAEENQLMILAIFFLVLIVLLPGGFIYYYQRQKKFAPNGVMLETMQFMGYNISEATRLKNCPELLSCSAESRAMQVSAEQDKDMQILVREVDDSVKIKFNKPGVIARNRILILAHMQRLHHLLSPSLRKELDEILSSSHKICTAMIELSVMQDFLDTSLAMVDFKRSLVQALDGSKNAQLLQIPHFTDARLRAAVKGKNGLKDLQDFLKRPLGERKGVADMDGQELADVDAFVSHVVPMEVSARVETEDEVDIAEGDVASVFVELSRPSLGDGMAVGPVHAPLFPRPAYENWYLFLENVQTGRLIAWSRVKSLEKTLEPVRLRFLAPRPGKYLFQLHVVCDAYTGLDRRVELPFQVCPSQQVKKEVFVHPEDADLDHHPTLFQQMMGAQMGDDDSSDDESDDGKAKDLKPAGPPPDVSDDED